MSNASFNEELISALVDGELTGAELAQAEKLVADNPQASQFAIDLQNQRRQFSRLPTFELDSSFADRVMNSLAASAPDSTAKTKPIPVPAKMPFAGPRLAVASILSLAAMLLLTLFVFPQLFNVNPAPENVAAKSGEVKQASDDAKPAAGAIKDDAVAETDAIGLKGAAGKFGDLADVQKQSVQRGSNKGLSNDMPEADVSDGLANNSDPFGNAASKNQKTKSGDGAVQLAEKDAKKKTIEASSPPRNLSQVVWIELEHGGLKQIESVLAKNNIQIAGADKNKMRQKLDDENAGRVQEERQIAGNGLNESESDIEAIYVYASPSQMVGAISQLSQNNRARISAFQMDDVKGFVQAPPQPAEMMNMRVQRTGPEQKTEGMDNAQKTESPQIAQREVQSNPSYGTAQQLNQRMELNKMSMRSGGGGLAAGMRRSRPPEGARDSQPVPPIQIDKNQTQQAKNSPSEAINRADADKIAKINAWFGLADRSPPKEQIQQYLLLVRTNPNRSQTDADSSKAEPKNESKSDR